MSKQKKSSDLIFVRVTQLRIFNSIPPYLFEQVKGRSWSVERLYKLAPLLVINGSNPLWVLMDNERAIKGVLWVVIDILSEKLNVIVFSVDEEYQDDSLKSVRDFLRKFIKDFVKGELKIKEKINWVTSEPEKFSEIGGQRAKTVLIEV